MWIGRRLLTGWASRLRFDSATFRDTMHAMTPIELGWLAGILDGEGSILLASRSQPNRFRQPTLSATSTDRKMLERLVSLVGGFISKVKKYKHQHRDAWIWKLNGAQRVLAVLRDVAPVLSVPKKRARAYHLLAHYDEATARNGHYTPEQRAAKRAFEEAFFAL